MPEDREIISIDKGADKAIKIKLTYWKDSPYIDIREYYLGEEDEYMPTKKGIRFSSDMIVDIISGLQEARHSIDS